MYVLLAMFGYLTVYIARVIKGPSIWDRLLGLNLISTKILVMIILFASLNNTSFLLDIAIVYALLGFIGLVFIARFLLDRIRREESNGNRG